jgi:hypothetical protein
MLQSPRFRNFIRRWRGPLAFLATILTMVVAVLQIEHLVPGTVKRWAGGPVRTLPPAPPHQEAARQPTVNPLPAASSAKKTQSTSQMTTGSLAPPLPCISVEDAVDTLRRLDPEGVERPQRFKSLYSKRTACFVARVTAQMSTRLEFVDTDPNSKKLPTVIVELAPGQSSREFATNQQVRIEGEFEVYVSTPDGQRDLIYIFKGRVVD